MFPPQLIMKSIPRTLTRIEKTHTLYVDLVPNNRRIYHIIRLACHHIVVPDYFKSTLELDNQGSYIGQSFTAPFFGHGIFPLGVFQDPNRENTTIDCKFELKWQSSFCQSKLDELNLSFRKKKGWLCVTLVKHTTDIWRTSLATFSFSQYVNAFHSTGTSSCCSLVVLWILLNKSLHSD